MFQQGFLDLPLILDYTNFPSHYTSRALDEFYLCGNLSTFFYNQKGSAATEKWREKSKTTNKKK